MPSVRTMDPSLNTVAKAAARETSWQLINEFCAVSSPYALKRLEGAFTESVRAYVEYTLMGHPKLAAEHLKKAHRWIERAKELRNGSTPPSAP